MPSCKSPHPRRDEAVSYAIANPAAPYADVAKLYGVSSKSLAVWVSRKRKAIGTLAAPPRVNGARPKPTNLIALPTPKPTPPPEIQEEFRGAALNAAKRVHELSKDAKLSLADATKILELTIGTYPLLSEMESGPKKSSGPSRLVSALLGATTDRDADTSEDESADVSGS